MPPQIMIYQACTRYILFLYCFILLAHPADMILTRMQMENTHQWFSGRAAFHRSGVALSQRVLICIRATGPPRPFSKRHVTGRGQSIKARWARTSESKERRMS